MNFHTPSLRVRSVQQLLFNEKNCLFIKYLKGLGHLCTISKRQPFFLTFLIFLCYHLPIRATEPLDSDCPNVEHYCESTCNETEESECVEFGTYSGESANMPYTLTGVLQKWHKVTLTFEGPESSETASPNPFSDYNLVVSFKNGPKRYDVLGYFAADGRAGETSATTGDKWRVHFAPDEIGTWEFSVSFKRGTNVAIEGGGQSAGYMDGLTGKFDIVPTDKRGQDNRAKGRLEYVGEHYLQYAETKDWFVKGGADAPENTLAYEDFDDVPNRNNRLKSWQPHAQDYNANEAAAFTWKNNKGTELLGAIHYLAAKGMNAFSFLTFSLSGDDENVFPHLLKVDVNTYNTYDDKDQWNKGVYHDRFDVSRLDQWEKIFEYADTKGMYLHFKTQETENDHKMDGGNVGPERKLYYRELVARFGHHLALNWNTGEENTQNATQEIAMADYLATIDPYGHNIVIHTYPNDKKRYDKLIGNQSKYTGASLQSGINSVHEDIVTWGEKSRSQGKKWIVANDEQGGANVGVERDPNGRKKVREEVVWGTLMGGGAGFEFYYGYGTGCTDLTCEDHRSRDQKYTDAAFALQFFQTYFQPYLPDVRSDDAATKSGDDFVIRNVDQTAYAIYRPNGGTTAIDLPNGNWNLSWYNPRNGRMGNTTLFSGRELTAPDDEDWVALLTNDAQPNGINLSILAPVNGNTFTLDETVPFRVAATSEVGDITKVKFYVGDIRVGQVSAAPFSLLLNGLTLGPKVLKAVAYNTENESKELSISITITDKDLGNGNCDTYAEKDGIIIFEAENQNPPAPWVIEKDRNATNGQYIRWNGGNQYNSPGKGVMTIPFQVTKTGRYRFTWHMRQSGGFRSDEANDSWVDFPDARFIGIKNGKEVEFQDFIKIFGNATGDFKWTATGDVDHIKYQIFVDFDQSGMYTMKLSGRSQGHQIDRVLLYHESVGKNKATNTDLSETKCDPDPEESCVENLRPTIEITKPVSNETFEVGQLVHIQSMAEDLDGTLNSVTYYANEVRLGQVTSAPFDFDWYPSDGGSYTIKAIVQDDCGGMQETSVAVQVRGTPSSGDASVVSFTLYNADTDQPIDAFSPIQEGAIINLAEVGKYLNIVANTNPNEVGSVQFILNDSPASIENVAPYSLGGDSNGDFSSWSPAVGKYVLKAIPYADGNKGGAAGTSLTIHFEVIDEDPVSKINPIVSILEPIDGAEYQQGIPIPIKATASDADGTIRAIEFYRNGTLIYTDEATPYEYELTNLEEGTHQLIAKAYDNDGNAAESAVKITIVATDPCAENITPAIKIMSPLSGETYTTDQSFELMTEVIDPDNNIDVVEFFQDDLKLGAVRQPPYQLTISNLDIGTYSFIVKVTDVCGGEASSDPIEIAVQDPDVSQRISIVNFTLYDSESNESIQGYDPLGSGIVIDLAQVGDKLNIVANTNPSQVGSVQFFLNNDEYAVENVAPYALHGDDEGDFKHWEPALGTYTLTAIPYPEKDKKGAIGLPNTIKFTIINSNEGKEEDCGFFEEVDGLVVIEGEHLAYSSPWEIQTNEDALGGEYLVWNGQDEHLSKGKGQIQTEIKINEPGRYKLLLRSKVSDPVEENKRYSTWIGFPNAKFIGVRENYQMVFDNYVEVFNESNADYGWNTTAYYSQNDYEVFVEFEKPGNYQMDIAARSVGHQLDRIVLFRKPKTEWEATLAGQPETACMNNEEDPCFGNLRPQVEILLPTAESVYELDQEVQVSIDAFDPDGKITYVEVYDADQLIGMKDQAPFEFEVTFTKTGLHPIKVLAYDDCGSMSISEALPINIELPTEEKGMRITGFTLYNSKTDTPIPAFEPLMDGDTLYLAEIGRFFNVVANTNDFPVGSVGFSVNGKLFRTENVFPYALAGDRSGNYYNWKPRTGTYLIEAIPYEGSSRRGASGKALAITLHVIKTEALPIVDKMTEMGRQVTPDHIGVIKRRSYQKQGGNLVRSEWGDFNSSGNKSSELVLAQNYPNPFRNQTIIEFQIVESSPVRFSVQDITGKQYIAINQSYPEGEHRIELDTDRWPGGVYYYSIAIGPRIWTKRMIRIE